MSATPKTRNTRSNSTTSSSTVTLTDIQSLISSAKNEIITMLKQELDKINSSLASMTTRMQNIETKLTDVMDRQHRHEQRILNLENELDCIKHTGGLHISEHIFDEIYNRDRRRTNLIVRGLPEPMSRTLEERKAKDMEALQRMLKSWQVEDASPTASFRLGQTKMNSHRLLKFKVNDQSQRAKYYKRQSF